MQILRLANAKLDYGYLNFSFYRLHRLQEIKITFQSVEVSLSQ